MADGRFSDKEKVLDTVLRTAQRDDPQEKLMSLLMVAKHLPSVYLDTAWASGARQQIVKAVTAPFIMSLLNPSKRAEIDLDTSRMMGMRFISAFAFDCAIAVQFVPCLPVLLKLLRTCDNPAIVELALDCTRHLTFCKPNKVEIPFSKVLRSVQAVEQRAGSGALSGWIEVSQAEFLARCSQMVDDLVSAGATTRAQSSAPVIQYKPLGSNAEAAAGGVGAVAAAAVLAALPAQLTAPHRDSAVQAAHSAAARLEKLASMYEFAFPAAKELHSLCVPAAATILKLLYTDLEPGHKSDMVRIATCITAMSGPSVWLHESVLPTGGSKHGRWAPLLLLLQLWGVELKLLLDAVDECCLAAWPEEADDTSGGDHTAASSSALSAPQAAAHAVDAGAGGGEGGDDEDSSDDEAPPPPAAGAAESKEAPKRPSAAAVPSEAFNWKPGEELPVRLKPPSEKRRQELHVAPRGVQDRCRVLTATLQRAQYGLLPLFRSVDASVQLLLQASEGGAGAGGLPAPQADTLGMFRGALQEVMKIVILHIGEYFAATTALGLVQPQQQTRYAVHTARCAVGLAYASPIVLAAHDCLLEYAAVDCGGLLDDLVQSAPALVRASSDALRVVQGPLSDAKAAQALLQAAALPLLGDTPPMHHWVGLLHDASQPLMLPAAQQWAAVADDQPTLLKALAEHGAVQQAAEWVLHWSRRCALAGMASQHQQAIGGSPASAAVASLPPCISVTGIEAAASAVQSLLALHAASESSEPLVREACSAGLKVATWLLLCAEGMQVAVEGGVPQGIVQLVTQASCLGDEQWQCAAGELYQLTAPDSTV